MGGETACSAGGEKKMNCCDRKGRIEPPNASASLVSCLWYWTHLPPVHPASENLIRREPDGNVRCPAAVRAKSPGR
jgi:hypothetical protein